MADKVTFRGATIRYCDMRRSEGGSFVRLHLTSEFTTPVLEAMGWEDPGDSVESANLDGDLIGRTMQLVPGDKKLKDHAISLDIDEVTAFKLVRVTENEATRRELRFVVRSPSPNAAGLLDQYIRTIGEAEAALTISYSVQEELPMEENKPAAAAKLGKEKTGCKGCDAGIPTRDNDDGEHVDGTSCKVFARAVPAQASEAGKAPTAAEKKRARLEEEEKKKAMRAAGGAVAFPSPNEFGVYDDDLAEELILTGKKCGAQINVLQIRDAAWITSVSVDVGEESSSGPLSAGPVFPSKEIALAHTAFHAADRIDRRPAAQDKPAIQGRWDAIREWLVEVYIKNSDAVTAEEGWMERDYSVTAPAEALQ